MVAVLVIVKASLADSRPGCPLIPHWGSAISEIGAPE